jgi:hypothetical protein
VAKGATGGVSIIGSSDLPDVLDQREC